MQSEVIYLTREGDKVNYSDTITCLLEVTRGTVQYVQCCHVALVEISACALTNGSRPFAKVHT